MATQLYSPILLRIRYCKIRYSYTTTKRFLCVVIKVLTNLKWLHRHQSARNFSTLYQTCREQQSWPTCQTSRIWDQKNLERNVCWIFNKTHSSIAARIAHRHLREWQQCHLYNGQWRCVPMERHFSQRRQHYPSPYMPHALLLCQVIKKDFVSRFTFYDNQDFSLSLASCTSSNSFALRFFGHSYRKECFI